MSVDDSAAAPVRGRYHLLSAIGRGGLGTVYRARDESLGRDVAVKIFDANATDEVDVQVQENEVNLLAALSHHSLVTLFDAGVDRTDPGRPRIFFVMDLVEGSDLKARLEQGALSTRQIAQIGYDLAEGIEYLHHRGVVHRDIKPANILLADYSDDGTRERAKLTDFGVALVRGHERTADENVTTGTAAYLSPEQARGETLGSSSDVYSLGLVLLECFTGETAFPGSAIPAALARLTHDPAIPEDLDPRWKSLLSAMTARQPADRPLINDLVLALHQTIVAETGRHREADAPIPEEESRAPEAELVDVPPDGALDRITAMAALAFSTDEEVAPLQDLAALVMSELELRLENRRAGPDPDPSAPTDSPTS
ncbi:serine/threonine-protein kinase [Cryobacterium fucosi]|uniref:serine/threonine-protein kinase n=1 Tax=Cryobacterium fucosi TaxID=1259157 RepID=UPI00141B903E|nr:serine/threonine-protein kinase [Cryobacterium fucosi]